MTTRAKVYFGIATVLSILAINLIWRYFDPNKQYTGVMLLAMIVVIRLNVYLFLKKSKANS